MNLQQCLMFVVVIYLTTCFQTLWSPPHAGLNNENDTTVMSLIIIFTKCAGCIVCCVEKIIYIFVIGSCILIYYRIEK